MLNSTKTQTGRAGNLGAYGRGVLGALVLGISLGIAIAVGEIGETRFGLGVVTRQIVQAVLCSGLAVPLIIWLRRTVDRRCLRGLGLPGFRESLYTFGLGIGVTIGSAILIFGLGTVLGWLRWSGIEWTTLLAFALTSALIIFFFEALPEELTLRGYTYQNLNTRASRWAAATYTTILFLLVPGIANLTQAIILALFERRLRTPSLLPAGEDPIIYFTFLAGFGVILIIARVVTGSLWTGIGIHLTSLLINRIILAGEPLRTGWSAELATPLAMLLIPTYLTCIAVALYMFAESRSYHVDWGAIDPENEPPTSG